MATLTGHGTSGRNHNQPGESRAAAVRSAGWMPAATLGSRAIVSSCKIVFGPGKWGTCARFRAYCRIRPNIKIPAKHPRNTPLPNATQIMVHLQAVRQATMRKVEAKGSSLIILIGIFAILDNRFFAMSGGSFRRCSEAWRVAKKNNSGITAWTADFVGLQADMYLCCLDTELQAKSLR